jgi:hypothetical protein
MGLRVPQNQTVTSKYTSGKEYMFNDTYREYIGYYYELNSKLFAGKEFSTTAPELIRIDSSKVNKLLTNSSTYVYGKISGVKIPSSKITTLPSSNTNNLLDKGGEYFLQFYSSKINSNIIKSIDENTYIRLQSDPLYKITFIGTYNNKNQTLDDAEKELPGLKDFLSV